MKQKIENIESRSIKVRNIIEQVPSIVMRIGITVIAIMVTALIAATAMIHYPEGSDLTLMEIIMGK